ncbi:NAD(P)/FAD-dependent oxidoreductase [Hyphomicrobium sp. CS1BSMeth3]|uniref:flavin-containing monooxygenase n=1 Tax=Hyphomicrobium sp. CS1BSMeth3 TaxID=1892844 RepID=UPI0009311409|nr:NAD(P)/FAD-dependent oxidoreductase [Hyphomicrobium sp. CS1BSMeth3]
MALSIGALRTALEHGSIPALLMCLVQLTRDLKWLSPRYAPKRDIRLFADDSGGLSDEVQAEVRAAMIDLIEDLRVGRRIVDGTIDAELFGRMLSICVGENVPREYVPMIIEQFALQTPDASVKRVDPAKVDHHLVVIVGAGLSGICAAIALSRLGIPYRLFEKNADVGGTWFENVYPEAGVDTPNHFYSYDFAPNYKWAHYFSKRNEVLDYIHDTADRFAIRASCELEKTVSAMEWDEATAKWHVEVECKDGTRETVRANAVIAAVGQLNQPKVPKIPGLETFPGPCFHTARWRTDVDLTGKRVGIVGTGASAMQLLRTVARQAKNVTIFQRSPQWVRPTADYHRRVNPGTIWLFENVPYYYQWYRFGLFWRFADGLLPSLYRDPDWPEPMRSVNRSNDRHRQQMTEYLLNELEGRPDLIAKSLPDYPPYGKRILVDNDWYKSLRRDNVELIDTSLKAIEESDVIDDSGGRHTLDVLVLATGFEAQRLLSPMEIRGRHGSTIRDVWGEDNPTAYLGMTVPGFPNFFCLYGPNTNLGHGGSAIFQAECQARYIASCLVEMIDGDIDGIDVRDEVHADYNRRLDAEHDKLVWTHPGMRNWYRNSAGRVFSVMPWRHVDYWHMTRTPDLLEYHLRTSKGWT